MKTTDVGQAMEQAVTARVTEHGDGYSVDASGYDDFRFTERAARRVAELIEESIWRWDDIQPILEAEGITIEPPSFATPQPAPPAGC